MKTVYRVESKRTGLGWYNHGHYKFDGWLSNANTTYALLHELIDMDYSPPVNSSDECLGGIEEYEYCGFGTFEQMANWFPRAVLREILFGAMSEWFEIVEYHVEEDFVREGWYQCVFQPTQAKSRIPLVYLPA